MTLDQIQGEKLFEGPDPYVVKVAPGDSILIRFGEFLSSPAARFKHHNLASKTKTVLEFKHHRQNGSKFWTSRAGYDLWFVVPKTAIELLDGPHWSYVRTLINGVKVTMSVSGGSGPPWTDYIGRQVDAGVGHGVRSLAKIAEVSIRDTEFEPIAQRWSDPRQEEFWNQQDARRQILSKLKVGVVVHFAAGYFDGDRNSMTITEIQRQNRMKWRKPTEADLAKNPRTVKLGSPSETAQIKRLVGFTGQNAWGRVGLTLDKVDWLKTKAELEALKP